MYITLSVGIALVGIASSASGRRKKDAIVPYILGFLILTLTILKSNDIAKIEIPVPIIFALSFIIIAAGFVFSCWYLNYLSNRNMGLNECMADYN